LTTENASVADETVGLITETISPYRIPVFNEVDERIGGRLRVFFLSERARRRWPVYREEIRFGYDILPGVAVQPAGPGSQVLYANLPVVGRLRKRHVGPVVVGGYNHFEFLWARFYTRGRGRPLILWSESVSAVRGRRPVRTALKTRFVKACDGWLVPGERAASQLVLLGADPDRIYTAPNAVDVAFWGADAPERRHAAGQMRLLFVGNLVRNKGVHLVLDALDHPDLRNLPVEIVGVGRAKRRLARQVERLGLNVEFLGHLDREALRERYRTADVFVFPTRADVWGLVLNEAMATGCVPVTTWAAGASGDLVVPGVTGVVVPSDDVPALQASLLALLDDPGLRDRLALAARERSLSYSPERCAEGFVEALEAII
jgi:glycosyltransferase involved in cell wall biosynthesis